MSSPMMIFLENKRKQNKRKEIKEKVKNFFTFSFQALCVALLALATLGVFYLLYSFDLQEMKFVILKWW